MPTPHWPPADVETLKVKWAEGYSAAIIAHTYLGGRYTRSAICGKAARLNLPMRDPTVLSQRQQRFRMPRQGGCKISLPKRAPEGVVARDLSPAAQEPEFIGPMGDFPALGTCRFPRGSGETFQCCGHPGNPYCAFHHQICRVKPHTTRLKGA